METVISEVEDWATLQTYANLEEASPLLALLSENGISYNTLSDAHRSGDGLNLDLENRGVDAVHIQVLPRDMEKAQRVLEILAGTVEDQLEENDYLKDFTDAELLDILKKFDEWNQVDYVLAARLLVQRGYPLNDEELSKWRSDRMHELERPTSAGPAFIAGAYMLALMGGLFGLFMGLQLRTHQKRLPDGRKVHGYTEKDRTHGGIVIALALCVLLCIALFFGTR